MQSQPTLSETFKFGDGVRRAVAPVARHLVTKHSRALKNGTPGSYLVVRLNKNESPPRSDLPCVVIARDSSSRHAAEGRSVEHSEGATFYVPFQAGESEVAATMAEALAWAEQHSVDCIYLQE